MRTSVSNEKNGVDEHSICCGRLQQTDDRYTTVKLNSTQLMSQLTHPKQLRDVTFTLPVQIENMARILDCLLVGHGIALLIPS